MWQEIKELKEKKNWNNIYSTAFLAQFYAFCTQFGFTIQALKYKENLSKKDIPVFNWFKHTKNFIKKQENILDYLKEHFKEKLSRNIIISNWEIFLIRIEIIYFYFICKVQPI
jgi:hypothetical protein